MPISIGNVNKKRKESRANKTPKKEKIKTKLHDPQPIFTDNDIQQSFNDWTTGCKCGEPLQSIQDKPGGNWTFYKKCPKCNMKSTKIYHTNTSVDNFLQSDFGKIFVESI